MDSQDNVRVQLKGMPTFPPVEKRATSPPPVAPKKKKSHWQVVLCALIILAAYFSGDYFGHDRGYDQGYKQGKTDTYDTAYAKGKDAGYTTGYDDGYDNGYSDGEKYGRAAEISKNLRSRIKTNSSPQVTYDYTVYITATGSKYHRWGCQYLKESCYYLLRSDQAPEAIRPALYVTHKQCAPAASATAAGAYSRHTNHHAHLLRVQRSRNKLGRSTPKRD